MSVVHPTDWINDEFDDVVAILTRKLRVSIALPRDIDFIVRQVRRYLDDPRPTMTTVRHINAARWAGAFRRALRSGHVMAVSQIRSRRRCSHRQARHFLAAASRDNATIAWLFGRPRRTVDEVLNGSPSPAQINEFLRSTGYRHAWFPRREFEPYQDDLSWAAKHRDPDSAPSISSSTLQRHRQAAREQAQKALQPRRPGEGRSKKKDRDNVPGQPVKK